MSQTTDAFNTCQKCNKKIIGVGYYFINSDRVCEECYNEIRKANAPPVGWICPVCGNDMSPYATVCRHAYENVEYNGTATTMEVNNE